MKKINTLLAASLLALSTNAFAGDCIALAGRYTVGKSESADYASMADVTNALKCGGVSGPVTFHLEGGTYKERVVIPAIEGASNINTITIESSGDATISFGTTDATMVLNGAQYVSFENIGIDHKAATYGNCMRIDGNSGNIRFKSVVFEGVECARTGANSATIYVTANAQKSAVAFEDCEINNGSSGICMGGMNAANMDSKTTITGSLFFNQYEAGLVLTNQDAPVITNNVFSTLSAYNGFKAISMDNITNNMIISNNIINAANGTIGLAMNNCKSQSTSYGQVSNNSIAVGGNGQKFGIYLTGTTDNQLLTFNRVKMMETSKDQAYYKNAGQGSNINLMNTMFYDLNTGSYTIIGNTYKDAFNQVPSNNSPLTAYANGISVEKVSPIK